MTQQDEIGLCPLRRMWRKFGVGWRGRSARAKVLRICWRSSSQGWLASEEPSACVRNLMDRRTIMVFALPETVVDHAFLQSELWICMTDSCRLVSCRRAVKTNMFVVFVVCANHVYPSSSVHIYIQYVSWLSYSLLLKPTALTNPEKLPSTKDELNPFLPLPEAAFPTWWKQSECEKPALGSINAQKQTAIISLVDPPAYLNTPEENQLHGVCATSQSKDNEVIVASPVTHPAGRDTCEGPWV